MVTGAPKAELIRRVIAGVAKGDAADALSAVGEAVAADADMGIFCMLLVERVRILLMLRYAPEFGKELAAELTESDREALEAFAERERFEDKFRNAPQVHPRLRRDRALAVAAAPLGTRHHGACRPSSCSLGMWLLFAFSGPILWALSTHIDEYLVERFFKHSDTAVLMVFTALIGVVMLPFIWFFAPG